MPSAAKKTALSVIAFFGAAAPAGPARDRSGQQSSRKGERCQCNHQSAYVTHTSGLPPPVPTSPCPRECSVAPGPPSPVTGTLAAGSDPSSRDSIAARGIAAEPEATRTRTGTTGASMQRMDLELDGQASGRDRRQPGHRQGDRPRSRRRRAATSSSPPAPRAAGGHRGRARPSDRATDRAGRGRHRLGQVDRSRRWSRRRSRRSAAIDILVNNAARPSGQAPPPKLADITDELFWDDMNVKVLGYLRCAQAVAPLMAAQGWGRIINISGLGARSTGSTLGSMRNVAVAALTKNLADELGPKGINVTVVHPGLTRTEATPGVVARLRRGPRHHRGGGRAGPDPAPSCASSTPRRWRGWWRSWRRPAASPSPATPSPAAAAMPGPDLLLTATAGRRSPSSPRAAASVARWPAPAVRLGGRRRRELEVTDGQLDLGLTGRVDDPGRAVGLPGDAHRRHGTRRSRPIPPHAAPPSVLPVPPPQRGTDPGAPAPGSVPGTRWRGRGEAGRGAAGTLLAHCGDGRSPAPGAARSRTAR